jgi:hypothetical protein
MRKDLFGLTVSEIFIHDQLSPLFLGLWQGINIRRVYWNRVAHLMFARNERERENKPRKAIAPKGLILT